MLIEIFSVFGRSGFGTKAKNADESFERSSSTKKLSNDEKN